MKLIRINETEYIDKEKIISVRFTEEKELIIFMLDMPSAVMVDRTLWERVCKVIGVDIPNGFKPK